MRNFSQSTSLFAGLAPAMCLAGVCVLPAEAQLTLLIDPTDLSVAMKNTGNQDVLFKQYRLSSAGGRLDAAGWNSIQRWAESAPVTTRAILRGPDDGLGATRESSRFVETESSAFVLAEDNAPGRAWLSPGEAFSLGKPFRAWPGDFVFEYHAVGPDGCDGADVTGTIASLAATLSGDADGDGQVGLKDFAVLKSEFGLTGGGLRSDFDQDGHAGLADFQILKVNFGNRATNPVPEPTGFLLALAGLAVILTARVAKFP